jgi:L-alanine-DL-glutamate epimerase-like enolase superfamily enzyme
LSVPLIAQIVIRQLKIPLTTPYEVSRSVFHDFRPIVVEMHDRDGRVGWGEVVISEGYTNESPEGGWRFCTAMAERLIGSNTVAAKAAIVPHAHESSHACTALTAAIEMIEGNPSLNIQEPVDVPLLVPVHTVTPDAIADEIAESLAAGFRTLKVKVGFDVDTDLARVARIQREVAGRATLRLDANQGFRRDAACRFAAALDPAGIELFEQPCPKADWDANAAVARVSTVPIMLDESIYDVADIERASRIEGVGYVKVKLKKLGGLDRLTAALDRIRQVGLKPVLGDGVSTDIACWMEACIARSTITNAGEMNGFLKLRERLFVEDLPFGDGSIRLLPSWSPILSTEALAAFTEVVERYGPSGRSAASGQRRRV